MAAPQAFAEKLGERLGLAAGEDEAAIAARACATGGGGACALARMGAQRCGSGSDQRPEARRRC